MAKSTVTKGEKVTTKVLITDKEGNHTIADPADVKFKFIEAVTPEDFLISKGIDPPMRDSPLQGKNSITFNQLVELLNEYKG